MKQANNDVVQLRWTKDIQDLPPKDVIDFVRVFVEHAARFVKGLERKGVSISLVGVKRSSTAVFVKVNGNTPSEERHILRRLGTELGDDPDFRRSVAAITQNRGRVKCGVGKADRGLRLLKPLPDVAEDPAIPPGFDTVFGELTRIGGEDPIVAQVRINLPKSALVDVVFDSRERAKTCTSLLYSYVEVTGLCSYRDRVPHKMTEVVSIVQIPARGDAELLADANAWVKQLVWEGHGDEEEE